MKKIFTLLAFLATISNSFAATYRTFLGYSVSGNTYTIWINSDTVFGETALAEINYNTNSYSGIDNGVKTFGIFTRSGVSGNWKVEITLPGGATNLQYQLATKNSSGSNYGFTGFSALSTVLAVETNVFSAKNNITSMILSWLTASEKDNALFQIERSANATDFSPIGEVKGAGNSTAVKNYTFTDVSPLSGVNYYRLKTVDYYGAVMLSKVVSVNFSSKNDTKVAVYPNPTRDVLRVDMNATDASTMTVQISDLMGRVVLSQNVSVNKGANFLPFNVSSLPSGAYFVKVNGNVTRFVKQ